MPQLASQIKFLSILAENSRKPYPEVVESTSIAARLNMSVGETRRLVQCLNDMGVVESDLEGQRCLITRKGIHLLERTTGC